MHLHFLKLGLWVGKKLLPLVQCDLVPRKWCLFSDNLVLLQEGRGKMSFQP